MLAGVSSVAQDLQLAIQTSRLLKASTAKTARYFLAQTNRINQIGNDKYRTCKDKQHPNPVGKWQRPGAVNWTGVLFGK